MKRIGKSFSRDMEFTGSCDVQMNVQSRLLQNLQQKGGMTLPSPGANQIRGSELRFPAVKGYMQGIQEKTAVVNLNEDQKTKIKEVTGWAPSKVEVSVVTAERSQQIALTKEQQKAIDDALGIQMTSLHVSREPIEITLK